jgi:branched-chain amino acid transport system permease protein
LEASSDAARLPVRANTGDRIRKYIGEYGLIALLLVMPVVYGFQDISNDGSLARLGNNVVDGLSNGAIWALVALGYTLVYGSI